MKKEEKKGGEYIDRKYLERRVRFVQQKNGNLIRK